ncbi:MAG: hypothetical protein HRT38_18495 [Alteromonadaceae bacterium]|nr:hypothetical protein [Alteromonadaceae bacterium]
MIKAVQLFIVGLLLGPVLAECLGGISTFLWLVDPELGKSLLNTVKLYFPFDSIIFSIALIKAVNEGSRMGLQLWSYILSGVYIVTSTYGFLDTNSLIEIAFYNLNYLCQIAALLTGSIVIYKYMERSQTPEEVSI